MNGIANINKPTGLSSSDVVIKARNAVSKAIGEKIKAGHLGTLDPGGAGVLPVTFGKATRLFDYFLKKDKTYRADFTFGVTTDTLDSYGKVIGKSESIPTLDDIKKIISEFTGKLLQVPPIYSSVSVNGKRAYDIARSGKEIELNAREIEIYSIDAVSQKNERTYTFDFHVSSGTYIRSVARDMASRLGSVAYMSSIIRTRSGAFDIAHARTLDEFLSDPLYDIVSLETALSCEASLTLSRGDETRVLNGVKTSVSRLIDNAKAIDMRGKKCGMDDYLREGGVAVLRLSNGKILGLFRSKDENADITARLI